MNWVDIAIIIIILIPGFIGYKTGLIKTAFLFVAFFLGALISSRYPLLPASFLEKNIDEPKIRYLINFAATFLIVFVAVNLAGAIVYRIISFTPLKWVDTWIGSGLGFLAGIIFAGYLVTYLASSHFLGSEELLKKSILTPILKDILGQIFH